MRITDTHLGKYFGQTSNCDRGTVDKTGSGPYASFNVTFEAVPQSFATFGIQTPGINSAHAVIQPAGKGTGQTLTMDFPGKMAEFVIQAGDLSDPLHPKGDISTMGITANCQNMVCSITADVYLN